MLFSRWRLVLKKTIKIDPFDNKSVKAAIKELEQYQKQLEERCKQLVIELANHGADVAKATIAGLPYSTGDLESSIYAIYDEKTHCAMIKADNEHAVFVELGTGIVGEGTYPNSEYLSIAQQFGWQGYYVGGENGCEFTTKDGRQGWITKMNNGQYFFTEGQEAKHFMDDAFHSVVESFEDTVRQIFNKSA